MYRPQSGSLYYIVHVYVKMSDDFGKEISGSTIERGNINNDP